jgi:hypothetical protein
MCRAWGATPPPRTERAERNAIQATGLDRQQYAPSPSNAMKIGGGSGQGRRGGRPFSATGATRRLARGFTIRHQTTSCECAKSEVRRTRYDGRRRLVRAGTGSPRGEPHSLADTPFDSDLEP